jgi:hypothetical protein
MEKHVVISGEVIIDVTFLWKTLRKTQLGRHSNRRRVTLNGFKDRMEG